MVRVTASISASLVLAASTLTWWGVLAIAVFGVLLVDLQRRVSDVLHQMDSVNERLDEQKKTVDDLKALVEGDTKGDGG